MSGDRVRIYAKLPKRDKLSFVGAVTSTDYKLIRNRIIGHSEGGLKSQITTLLQKAGWNAKRDDRNIFTPVCEVFMQTPDVELDKFVNFVKHKEHKRNFTDYLRTRKPFNLYDMVQQGMRGIYPHQSLTKLVDELWTITTCVNQVGVGPGEICLTSLTDAKKGSKGDLLLTSVGDVELKSTFGRLGSGDNALLFTERIKDLFSVKKLSISNVRALRAKQDGKEINPKKDPLNWSWNDAAQSFFLYDWGFQPNVILAAMTYLSTQRLNPNTHGRLVAALRDIIREYNIVEKLQKHDRAELIKLVLTIQMCTYQHDQKFSYLLAVNKKTKDACPIFFKNKVEDNIISVYHQITKVNRFSSNLAIDSEGARKGVEINFN